MSAFFDDAAKARVEAAVKAAELRSRGEIVPVVVDRCDAYPEAQDRGGIAAAILASVIYLSIPAGWVPPEVDVLHLPWGLHVPLLLVVQAAAFPVGWLLARWDPLERLLIGKRALATTALWRAELAFREHGLQRTREGTGVLIFAAIFEHQVVVLGDHGIHAAVGEKAWERAVADLLAGIRQGDPASGFVKAVEHVGEELARHFPRAAGDVNELPDRLNVT